MIDKLDYPVIDKGCNGAFILYANHWHRLIEITDTCYNSDMPFIPQKGTIIISNSGICQNTLIITKMIFSVDWINTLEYNTFGSIW